jgi:YMGG-like Gly-zipper/WXXGXW repeat (2 copies)
MIKRYNFVVSLLGISVLLGGCAETGPNTQKGAVNGAAMGALAGAIIGNNSGGGSHNGATGAAIGALAGALIGGTMGNQMDHERGTIYTSEAQARTNTVIVATPPAPPPVPSEVIPDRPAPGAVWVGGYWQYNQNSRYEWVSGSWEMPPPNCSAFVPPHWQPDGNGFVYVLGYWRV